MENSLTLYFWYEYNDFNTTSGRTDGLLVMISKSVPEKNLKLFWNLQHEGNIFAEQK